MESNSAARIVIAAIAAAVGLTAAVLVDGVLPTLILILVTLAVVLWCVLPLRGRDDHSPLAAVLTVPLVFAGVGVSVTIVVSVVTEPPPAASTAAGRDTSNGFPDRGVEGLGDLNTRLRTALDRADALTPDGSDNILRIDLGDAPDGPTVTVLDARDGSEWTSSLSGSEWTDRHSRTNQRSTFSRAEVAGMDLSAALPKVIAAADGMAVDRSFIHASDGVVVGRRVADKLLVATFSLSGRQIEVNAQGELPDNLAAAKLSGMVDVARALIVEAGLDPRTARIDVLQYRTYADGSSAVGATVIQSSGGIDIRFAGGSAATSATTVPGQFPEFDHDRSWAFDVFAFADLDQQVLDDVLADIVARNRVPAYDAGLVGVSIGIAPFDRNFGPVIRMTVGPVSSQVGGIYTLDGRWLADRWY